MLEKLGRNRRIDAVLILLPDPAALVSEIREDNAAPPPLFCPWPAGEEAPEGCRALTPGHPQALLNGVIRAISA